MIDDTELDRLLEESPRAAKPPRDLWPSVSAATAEGRSNRQPLLAAAAVAVLFFGLGTVTGMALDGSRPTASPPEEAEVAPAALLAAARVQAAGSEYVAAVGELQQVRARPGSGDLASLSQGYEAALVAVEAVVEAIRGHPPADADAGLEELADRAETARRAQSAAVVQLLDQGASP